MVLSKLTSRLPDSLGDRLPGRPDSLPGAPVDTPDVPVDATDLPVGTPDVGLDEELTDKLSTGFSLVTLAGLGLATLGVAARLLLDRARSDEADADEAIGDVEADDAPLATGHDDADDADAEPADSDEETEPEPPDDPDPGTPEYMESSFGTDSSVEATELETDESTSVTTARERTATNRLEAAGPPRIAPLVGMVALVGIKFFIEKFGDE